MEKQTLSVVLSGDDLIRYQKIVEVNTLNFEPSVSAMLKNIIRREYNRLVDDKKVDDSIEELYKIVK